MVNAPRKGNAPFELNEAANEDALWYESESEGRLRIRRAAGRRRLLDWVRRHMESELTECERECIWLYYFQGMGYRQAGAIRGKNPTSVMRAVQRGLRKLRRSAAEDDSWRRYWF